MATKHFTTSLDKNPRKADCLYELGKLQQLRGQVNIEKAEEFFKRALEIDPHHKKALQAIQAIQALMQEWPLLINYMKRTRPDPETEKTHSDRKKRKSSSPQKLNQPVRLTFQEMKRRKQVLESVPEDELPQT